MSSDTLAVLINLALSLLTLGIVMRFWWRHRQTQFARAWWIVTFAFGIFTISEALGFVFLFREHTPANSFSLTIRVLFMVTLIGGLSLVFEDVLSWHQRALSEAQKAMQLQADTLSRAQEAELLVRVGEQLVSSLDLDTVLHELCRETRILLEADSVSVRLPVETDEGFRFAVDFASALKEQPEQLDPQIDALCWRVVETGRPAIVEDAQTSQFFGAECPDWLGALGAFPLRRSREVIGVLTAVFDHPQPFSVETRRLLTSLADYAAIAVHNAQLHETVKYHARTDGLTGLANRRRFNDTLTDEITRARRYKLPLALILIDVDKLKTVNDFYSHVAGDVLLQAVAQALRNSVRATDLPARVGGDEFAVIMPNASLDQAQQVAKRILREAGRLAFDWDGEIIPVKISVGVSGGQNIDLPNAAELIAAADDDLYRARGGREKR